MVNENLVTTRCCNVCNKVKELNNFSKLVKDYRKTCKACRRVQHINRDRTEKGLIRRIFTDQKANSKKRGHELPSYSLEELEVWVYAQESFKSLYSNWVNQDYEKDKRPSVDRLNDFKGYSLDNIRLITWGENNRRNHKDKFKALGTHTDLIEIHQYTNEGIFLNTYPSISIAARAVGLKSGASILGAIKKDNLAANFRWSKSKYPVLKINSVKVKFNKNTKIEQSSTEGIIIKVWDDYAQIISEFNGGKRARSIEEAVKGFTKIAYGYRWRYFSASNQAPTEEIIAKLKE